MKSVSSAPGKVILFGEHFVVYGSKAILAAIEKRVTVTTIDIKEKFIIINSSLDKEKIPLSSKVSDIKPTLRPFFHIAKKMIKHHNHKDGLSITIDSQLPPGVGLGSSSACCVAAASSISGCFENKSNDEILDLAIEAEKTIFENTSGADCSVCTFGGLIEYNKQDGYKKLNIESDFSLVIINSNIIHSTDEVVNKVKKYKEENKEFISMCSDLDKLILDATDALNSNDLISFGRFMLQNQELLEKIGISNKELRSIIDVVRNCAYGAKITGAGYGGCVIALTDISNKDQTMNILKDKGFECFSVRIDSKGLEHSVLN